MLCSVQGAGATAHAPAKAALSTPERFCGRARRGVGAWSSGARRDSMAAELGAEPVGL